MGDPDYLMTIVGLYQQLSTDAQTSANAIYGDDFTINPLAGQVFIQIYFKTAEDYNNPGYNGKPNDGLMDVNDQIQFYSSPKAQSVLSQQGADGLIYKLQTVDNTFSKGQFTQSMTLQNYVPDSNLLNSDQKDVLKPETVQTEKNDPAVNTTPGTPNANENQTYDEFGTPIPKARIEKQVAGYQGDLIAADYAASTPTTGVTPAPKTEQGNNADKTVTQGTEPAPQGREATLPYAPSSLKAQNRRNNAASSATGRL
jgi:hypothetical protein